MDIGSCPFKRPTTLIQAGFPEPLTAHIYPSKINVYDLWLALQNKPLKAKLTT